MQPATVNQLTRALQLAYHYLDPLALRATSEQFYVDYVLETADFYYLVDEAYAGEKNARNVVEFFAETWDDIWHGEVEMPPPVEAYIRDKGLNRVGRAKPGPTPRHLYRDQLIRVVGRELEKFGFRKTRGQVKRGIVSGAMIINAVLSAHGIKIGERTIESILEKPPLPVS